MKIAGTLVAGEQSFNGSVVIGTDGRIVGIETGRLAGGRPTIDATGFLVLPGFIDMHVHGGGGADFMHGTPEAARRVARTHARRGTTGLLATTLTESREAIDAAVLASRAIIESVRGDEEARILGIHLEGPYICPAKRGAQPAAHVRPPDPDELGHWIALSGGSIRQITLAPETPGAEAAIRLARDAGVVVSIGHTDALAEDVARAIAWGATQATHVFNAMRGIHHREPGAAGTALARPEIVCEVIADGVHLHPEIIRLITLAKGVDGVVLITDAIEGACMPDGEYRLGGFPVMVRDGSASFADGTLAGSALTMDRAFHNMSHFTDLPAHAVSRMASWNAARQLGISDRVGSIEIGKDADLVILDPETGVVEWTIIGGKVAYQR